MDLVINSFAYSMVILMAIHLIQTIISLFIDLPGEFSFIISSGGPGGEYLGNSPFHIEHIFFDAFLIVTVYNIKRYRSSDITFKELTRPLLISFVMSLVLSILMFAFVR